MVCYSLFWLIALFGFQHITGQHKCATSHSPRYWNESGARFRIVGETNHGSCLADYWGAESEGRSNGVCENIGEACIVDPGSEVYPNAEIERYRCDINRFNGRLAKRTEEVRTSRTPLKDAINVFGDLAESALDGSESLEILTNIFPRNKKNAHVSGLKGYYTLPRRLIVVSGGFRYIFHSNEKLFWEIRWDFDPSKGPHVNAVFGTVKIAFKLDPSEYTIFAPENLKAEYTFAKITDVLNSVVGGYKQADNEGQDNPQFPGDPRYPAANRNTSRDKLKEYFQRARLTMAGPPIS